MLKQVRLQGDLPGFREQRQVALPEEEREVAAEDPAENRDRREERVQRVVLELGSPELRPRPEECGRAGEDLTASGGGDPSFIVYS